MRVAAPFVPTLRELLEMRYLWKEPVQMVNSRLVQVLGREPHTPLDQAVEASLIGMGCVHVSSSPGVQPVSCPDAV
jgi:nucleoside-diphosphate-sugar epimerase